MLWRLHLALDQRGVQPCLRWPENVKSEQHVFVTLLADLFWFSSRHRALAPAHRGWRGLWSHAPASNGWHAAAHRQYLFVRSRYSLSHWCSKGLALTVAQRADLMTMPTTKMEADRRMLKGEPFTSICQALLDDAVAHPDRSGARTAERIANRRAQLWQVYVLSGRNVTEATRRWAVLTGEAMSRQSLCRQLDAMERATGRRP